MYQTDPVCRLRVRIAALEDILEDLKRQLADAEAYHNQTPPAKVDTNGHSQTPAITYSSVQPVSYDEKTFESLIDQLDLPQEDGERWGRNLELTAREYKRYGRQLIMPEIGLRGGASPLVHKVRLCLTHLGNRTATT